MPVESAVGVMLYQMGIGSFVFFGFLAALAATAARRLVETGRSDFLFAFVAVVTISANAVLQEEAFFSPLALGLALLLTGVSFGNTIREASSGNSSSMLRIRENREFSQRAWAMIRRGKA